MEKLEQYLDQVCRRIGGPVEMRQHVRQELREHLLDAVAQHQAAGLPDEAALAKAIEEFGKPDEVRTELEATHGQRMMWIIDKAIQWKEKTMRAKWLWMSWAYLGLGLVIALEVLLLTFIVLAIIPKFFVLMHYGMIEADVLEDHGVLWMVDFLRTLKYVAGSFTIFLVLVPAAAWGLFEWRVRGDNKPLMRVSALGTAAVGLMVVIMLTVGALLISFCLAMPPMGVMARPWAVEQVAAIDTALSALDKALTEKNWKAVQEETDRTHGAMTRLSGGPAVSSLSKRNESPSVEDLQGRLRGAREGLHKVQLAIIAEDSARAVAELATVRQMFAPLREAAKRPAP